MAIAKQVAQSPANECRAGIGNKMQTDAMLDEPRKRIACFFSLGGERGIVSLCMGGTGVFAPRRREPIGRPPRTCI